MKDFFANLGNKLGKMLDTKAALIVSSCLLLPAAAVFLIVQATAFFQSRNVPDILIMPETEISAEIPSSPTPDISPSPEVASSPVQLSLSLTSSELDLDIRILDSDGNPVKNVVFAVSVTGPDGKRDYYRCTDEGSYYLEGLSEGDYVVSIMSKSGYISPKPSACTVKGEVKHVKIENIEEIVDIKDVSEISLSEVKTGGNAAPVEVTPEIIYSSDLGGSDVIYGSTPVLDSNGNPTYTYEFETGPNGYLLYSDTREESDVIPIDEGYGVYYGLRKVAAEVTPTESPYEPDPDSSENLPSGRQDPDGHENDEDNNDSETAQPPVIKYYTVAVDIINPDNTPVSIYSIKATPIMQSDYAKLGWVTEDGRTYYYETEGEKAVGLKNIDGTLYYFNQYGEKAKSVGIDVSFYNPRINWQAVKAQGVDFAIIRVGGRGWSSGDIYDDTCFNRYLSGAKGAGIKVGVYFYSTAISNYEAVTEASVVLDRLGGVALDYPVFMDVEYSNEYPDGRSDTLTAEQRATIVNAFCETIENGGYSAGVYSGQNFFNLGSLYPSSVSRYTIWLASYTKDNKLPNFSSRYDIWQFTDRGIVNGIDGVVDMNVIF